MGFLKKLAGVFGFGQEAVKNEEDDTVIDSGDGDKRRENNQPRFRETRLPRKGFGVPVQVAVERSQLGPVLQPCSAGDGGIQGLRWYTKRLRVDEDGDVADEFLEEGDKPTNAEDDHSSKTMPRLEAKRKTKPAKTAYKGNLLRLHRASTSAKRTSPKNDTYWSLSHSRTQ
ncbi:hypothetical protein Bca4012_087262 [Brassica carinata]